MPHPRKILVVDDDDHSRFVLTKTLLRRFPHVVMLECIQGSSAITTATFEQLDLIVVHRAEDMGALEVVRALRRIAPGRPVLLVSNVDQGEAVAAGATRCLTSIDAIQIGVVAGDVLGEKTRSCA